MVEPIPDQTLIEETIGDAILLLCMRVLFREKFADPLYRKYRGVLGDYTTNKYLGNIAQAENWPPIGKSSTRYGKSFEVYLGKFYLEHGIEATKAEVERLIEKYTGWETISQIVAQRRGINPPKKAANPVAAPPPLPQPKRIEKPTPPQPLPIVQKPTSVCLHRKANALTEEEIHRFKNQPTIIYSKHLGGYMTTSEQRTWRTDLAASYRFEDALELLKKYPTVQDFELTIHPP